MSDATYRVCLSGKGLTKVFGFGRNKTVAVDHVDFDFYEGEIIHPALLKWVLQKKYITTAVPGYTTFKQLEDDFTAAYNIVYTPEEKKFLDDRKVRLSLKSVCRQCSYCIQTCPNMVDIPNLIRAHMYATCYSNFSAAEETLKDIPKQRNIENCTLCSSCIAQCANRVNIAKRIHELRTIYC